MAPRRSRLSDGSIGDAAHSARSSDHNPYAGYVHALDITHDPRRGMDIHAHARNIAARHDARIEYIISNWQIWERETGRWRKYTGTNGHTKHAHFSVRHTPWARNDTSAWLSAVIPFPSPTLPPVIIQPKPPVIVQPPIVIPETPILPNPLEDDMIVITLKYDGSRAAEDWLYVGTVGTKPACWINLNKTTGEVEALAAAHGRSLVVGDRACDLVKSFHKEITFNDLKAFQG
jgi:hypothetical protein